MSHYEESTMRKRCAVVALQLVLLALLPLVSQASLRASGGVVGTGTPESCHHAALSDALAGGGEITFNCGAAAHTITLDAVETITRETTIDGGGRITISGGNATRLFDVEPGVPLTLRRLTLRDGNEPQVSGIENHGSLVLEEVFFLSHEEGIVAISNQGSLTIRASTFEGNQNGATGVIYNRGTLLVEGSTFSQNRSSSPSHGGGAIYNHEDGTATIRESHFYNNSSTQGGNGGALFNRGRMELTRTTLTGNQSTNHGGALYNEAILTISESTLTSNSTNGEGGAIHYQSDTLPSSLLVTHSAIHSNQAQGWGGGINVFAEKGTISLTVRESTISTNSARLGGGIAVAHGNGTLQNVTLAVNQATSEGIGANLYTRSGALTLRNTIVAAGRCDGAITDGGHNLQFPGTSCGASIPDADPQLGPLQDNGGRTLTHAIAVGSPARNGGSDAHCATTDQRGILRPQQATCDIGAFEWGARPHLGHLSPAQATALDPTRTLTIQGSNFIPGSKGTRAMWAGTALATTYVSPTVLLATVPAAMLVGGGSLSVTVQTPTIDGAESDPLTFVIHKRAQAITFAPLASRPLRESPFTVSASASSTLPVTFSAQGVCTVAGNQVTLTGPGLCTITARQAGNESYLPAAEVPQRFSVTDQQRIYLPLVIR